MFIVSRGVNMSERKPELNKNPLGIGIAIGLAIGAGFGVIFGNLALGIGVGISMGVVIGAARKRRNNKDVS